MGRIHQGLEKGGLQEEEITSNCPDLFDLTDLMQPSYIWDMKIFLIGFMGSGKTYWGRIWAANGGLEFYDLDELIEKTENRSVTVIFGEKGENYFREKEAALLRTFSEKENFLLACGGGVPCFKDNIHWMNANGTTVYLSASPLYLFEKITNEKDKRPLLKNLNPGEVLFFIEQKLKERNPLYQQAKITLKVNTLNDKSLLDLNL